MRIYQPGILMIPLVLGAIVVVGFLDNLGIVQFAGIWSFWPVTLIATGLEELYLWATTKDNR